MQKIDPAVRPDVSKWQDERAERNRRSLERLTKVLPPIFPSAILSRALGRAFIPPTPRLVIDSYWRAHPIRADRHARALAARTGHPLVGRGGLGRPPDSAVGNQFSASAGMCRPTDDEDNRVSRRHLRPKRVSAKD